MSRDPLYTTYQQGPPKLGEGLKPPAWVPPIDKSTPWANVTPMTLGIPLGNRNKGVKDQLRLDSIARRSTSKAENVSYTLKFSKPWMPRERNDIPNILHSGDVH